MLLYIFNAAETWKYKIGHTKSKTSRHRMKQCQTGNPDKIEMVWEFESEYAKEIETAMHRAYASYRMSGEWFLFENISIEDLKNRVKEFDNIIKLFKDETKTSYCNRY